MQWSVGRRAWRAAWGVSWLGVLLAAVCTMALAACDLEGHPGTLAGQPRGATVASWVWDVFDRDDRRALRIAGEETAKGRRHDAWSAADDQMLHRIARSSMDKLTAFLTSPGVAPGMPDSEPRMALAGTSDSSPEAAGIFRIFQPKADPAPIDTAETPAATAAGPVPLPPRRPPLTAAVSAGETLTLAAASH